MESTTHRDYADSAERTYDAVQALLCIAQNPEVAELGLDLAAEKEKAEAGLRRARLLLKLKDATGFDFAVFDGAEMPGVAGFVKTNGEQTIYIAEHVLDDPAFADHVAKHEAYHLKTMLVLPVETDFSPEHFSTLNRYLPEKFESNEFYLEGFNEWLTALHDDQNESVTGYQKNVAAAKMLEALAYSATGESLLRSFERGNYAGFARILKTTTDRLMLHQALEAGAYEKAEINQLKPYIKLYPEPVASPEKASVIIESWSAKLKDEKLKKMLIANDYDSLNASIAEQRAQEKANARHATISLS